MQARQLGVDVEVLGHLALRKSACSISTPTVADLLHRLDQHPDKGGVGASNSAS